MHLSTNSKLNIIIYKKYLAIIWVNIVHQTPSFATLFSDLEVIKKTGSLWYELYSDWAWTVGRSTAIMTRSLPKYNWSIC